MFTAIQEMVSVINSGGKMALIGFGMYLGYKISITGMISYTVIRVAGKLIELYISEKKKIN